MSREKRDSSPAPWDSIDDSLRAHARRGEHLLDTASGPHIDAEQLLGHLQHRLGEEGRRGVVAHLASCSICVERLEVASENLRVDLLPNLGSFELSGLSSLDIGPSLMRIALKVNADSLCVLSSDVEMRVGISAAMRRRGGHQGVAFRRVLELDGQPCPLDIELLESRNGGISASVSLVQGPTASRLSIIVAGRLHETKPLRKGQTIVHDLPLRDVFLRLEAPGRILGHIQLDLSQDIQP
ncbi:MAG: hypothetical protein AUK47_09780 [Deltaproteobacteria bacterium CG2_30_63_29]|nr:MAG: hypothetical protein AUK47_09780 [Deltaproteobacteria bacterium CG2_30_63_29]PJB40562.1 MAG: hypothetical protein CO108_14500 [Deltaproteobacteria bacterium CG_4_9_14_3_um_filter_63_12]